MASHSPLGQLRRTLGKHWDAALAVIAVGVAVVYFAPQLLGGNLSSGTDVITGPGGGYQTQAPASGPAARSTATANPAGPFSATPAATWAEGAAGIAIPEASDVEGFAAADVAAALAQVKSAMVAARLDERMLVAHDPSGLLDLVAPASRVDLGHHIRDELPSTLMVVTQLGTDAHLGLHPPRVSGRTSFSPATQDGRPVLDVVTNYVWVYAFDDDAVVLVHDEVTWRFYRSGDVPRESVGLWLTKWSGYVMGVDCAAANRGLLAPPSQTNRPSSGQVGEHPNSYFAQDHTLDVTTTCANA